ncbi:hypothetical protein D3C76_134690 [compost metagenome]
MIRCLTAEELEDLTGFKRAAAQKRWLADNEFPYIDGGDGVPKVLEQVVLQRLGGKPAKKGPQLRLTG